MTDQPIESAPAAAPAAQPDDKLSALRKRLAAAQATKIEIPDEAQEEAKLLAALAAESERIAREKKERDEYLMNKARLEVRERVGDGVPLESTVIENVGAFVVRAPTREQRKRLNDAAGKAGFEAASMTFAVQVTEYPGKDELKDIFERFPYVIDTIVTMGMRAGGAQIDAERRKSG